MYPEHHNFPYIHIDCGRIVHTASYSIENIENCERLAGNLERKYDKAVKKWIENNKVKLMEIWGEIKNGNTPNSLICELL